MTTMAPSSTYSQPCSPPGSMVNELTDVPLSMETPHWARNFQTHSPIEDYTRATRTEKRQEHPQHDQPFPATHTESHSPLPQPEYWKAEHPYIYLDPSRGDSWATLRQGIQKHDDERCKGWREDLETLLVFTGLFSAVVTAFIVESSKTLSQDPLETTNEILFAISQQLSSPTARMANKDEIARFSADKPNVQINVLYFISLTLALSVSSMCILAKQWIREFQRDTPGSSCDYVRIRQARFDALQEWKVPAILAALPVMLQASLLLFFAGLLEQLWHIGDHTAAAVVSVVVGVAVLLVVVTTVVPAHWSQNSNRTRFTPFRSPQAWIYLAAYQRVCRLFGLLDVPEILGSWVEFDIKFLSDENEYSTNSNPSSVTSVHRALRWVWSIFRNASDMENSLFWCLHPENLPFDWSKPHELELGLYVFSGEDAHKSNIAPVHADLSHLGNSRGRLHAEMLLRTANLAIDRFDESSNTSNLAALNKAVSRICKRLKSFDHIFCPDVHETDGTVQTHINLIHEQSVLMLERYINVVLTRRSLHSEENNRLIWTGITDLFVMIHAATASTPFAHHASKELLPRTLRCIVAGPTEASIAFLCSMGSSFASMSASRPSLVEESFRMFYMLDQAMVNMIEHREETSRKLRSEWDWIRSSIINRYNNVAKTLESRPLPKDYFNKYHPCVGLDTLIREALESVAAV